MFYDYSITIRAMVYQQWICTIFRFPKAKIIGTPASEAKLNHINALTRKRFEINCQDESQLSALNSVLEEEGVKIFYISGDVATNAIVLVAHEIALGKQSYSWSYFHTLFITTYFEFWLANLIKYLAKNKL